jgi:hypothetical protein
MDVTHTRFPARSTHQDPEDFARACARVSACEAGPPASVRPLVAGWDTTYAWQPWHGSAWQAWAIFAARSRAIAARASSG